MLISKLLAFAVTGLHMVNCYAIELPSLVAIFPTLTRRQADFPIAFPTLVPRQERPPQRITIPRNSTIFTQGNFTNSASDRNSTVGTNSTRSSSYRNEHEGSYWEPQLTQGSKGDVLSVPVKLDPLQGWYTYIKVGTEREGVSKRSKRPFKMVMSTVDDRSWVRSQFQAYSDRQDDDRTFFDLNSTSSTFEHPNRYKSGDGIKVAWNSSSQNGKWPPRKEVVIQGGGFDYLSVRDQKISGKNNIALIKAESGFDSIDGRFGLAYGKTAFGRDNLDERTGLFRSDTAFATYFPSVEDSDLRSNSTTETAVNPVIQFNVDPTDGDRTKYVGSIEWATTLSAKGMWAVSSSAVRIDGKTLFVEELTIEDFKPSDDIRYIEFGEETEEPTILQTNVSYIADTILDSTSLWTRLHPSIVDEIYAKIQDSIYEHGTYWVRCDNNESAASLPKIELGIEVESGDVKYFAMDMHDFVVGEIVKPDDDDYCAGTVQNAVWYDQTGGKARERVANGVFGQWVFKNLYIVFKNTLSLSGDESEPDKRQVGVAKIKAARPAESDGLEADVDDEDAEDFVDDLGSGDDLDWDGGFGNEDGFEDLDGVDDELL